MLSQLHRSLGHRLVPLLLLAAVALALAGSAYAQQAPAGPQSLAELTRLADDVYVFRYETYQTIFIVTDDGVIAADPISLQNTAIAPLYKAAIASVTDQPVRYVVYGHDHNDHITGGDVFADTAQFVSQRLAAARIAARADPRAPVPTILFDDHLTLELGGKTVELYYIGPAHSDNDLILVYPARRIAFVADVIEPEGLPPMGQSNPEEYLAAMRWIENNVDFDVLVGGHGPLGSMDSVHQLRAYIEDLMAAIRAAEARGVTGNSSEMVAAVRAALAPRYGAWDGFDRRLGGNVAAVIRIWSDNPGS
jgi:glyoxylase-like metal-dependent hydrolase (beta-lactamase superfamily II)